MPPTTADAAPGAEAYHDAPEMPRPEGGEAYHDAPKMPRPVGGGRCPQPPASRPTIGSGVSWEGRMEAERNFEGYFASGGTGDSLGMTRVVVMGTQSSGKTSLLNAFANIRDVDGRPIEMLPTGSETTTRCAIRLELGHVAEGDAKLNTATVAFTNERSSGSSPAAPGRLISTISRMNETFGGSFSDKTLCVKHWASHDERPTPIALVDLPGFASGIMRDREQIEDIVKREVNKPSTVVVVVAKCTDDAGTDPSFELLKSANVNPSQVVVVHSQLDLIGTSSLKDKLKLKVRHIDKTLPRVRHFGSALARPGFEEDMREVQERIDGVLSEDWPTILGKGNFGTGTAEIVTFLDELITRDHNVSMPRLIAKTKAKIAEIREAIADTPPLLREKEIAHVLQFLTSDVTRFGSMRFKNDSRVGVNDAIDSFCKGEIEKLQREPIGSMHERLIEAGRKEGELDKGDLQLKDHFNKTFGDTGNAAYQSFLKTGERYLRCVHDHLCKQLDTTDIDLSVVNKDYTRKIRVGDDYAGLAEAIRSHLRGYFTPGGAKSSSLVTQATDLFAQQLQLATSHISTVSPQFEVLKASFEQRKNRTREKLEGVLALARQGGQCDAWLGLVDPDRSLRSLVDAILGDFTVAYSDQGALGGVNNLLDEMKRRMESMAAPPVQATPPSVEQSYAPVEAALPRVYADVKDCGWFGVKDPHFHAIDESGISIWCGTKDLFMIKADHPDLRIPIPVLRRLWDRGGLMRGDRVLKLKDRLAGLNMNYEFASTVQRTEYIDALGRVIRRTQPAPAPAPAPPTVDPSATEATAEPPAPAPLSEDDQRIREALSELSTKWSETRQAYEVQKAEFTTKTHVAPMAGPDERARILREREDFLLKFALCTEFLGTELKRTSFVMYFIEKVAMPDLQLHYKRSALEDMRCQIEGIGRPTHDSHEMNNLRDQEVFLQRALAALTQQ